jgi:hypothetical protein
MKVLLATGSFNIPGYGPGVAAATLAQALVAAGHEVVVAAPKAGEAVDGVRVLSNFPRLLQAEAPECVVLSGIPWIADYAAPLLAQAIRSGHCRPSHVVSWSHSGEQETRMLESILLEVLSRCVPVTLAVCSEACAGFAQRLRPLVLHPVPPAVESVVGPRDRIVVPNVFKGQKTALAVAGRLTELPWLVIRCRSELDPAWRELGHVEAWEEPRLPGGLRRLRDLPAGGCPARGLGRRAQGGGLHRQDGLPSGR